MPKEPDPATQRRYLMALTSFENPVLAERAQGLLFTDTVKTQDAAAFISGLLANRTGRDAWWARMQKQWKDVAARTGTAPMLMRRVVEALGHLRTREHLEQVKALLEANPLPEAQQAARQTLERLSQDVALRERTAPEVSAWLKRLP
jgi:puromycin-sensitive aminopeptidase